MYSYGVTALHPGPDWPRVIAAYKLSVFAHIVDTSLTVSAPLIKRGIYVFSSLEIKARRIALDRAGLVAHFSVLVPLVVLLILRFGKWIVRRSVKNDYDAVPGSPIRKAARLETGVKVSRTWGRVSWWLDEEMVAGWGERKFWIAGLGWWAWLITLCVVGTGDDYMHITKRFGIVAVSQFPIHYMLSMKSAYSPLSLALNTSHEELNPYHRVLGRVIYSLLFLHASWYLNFFAWAGFLSALYKRPVVIIGWTVFLLITTMVTTALEPIRRWSYRVFFTIHLIFGIIILPMLFFHTSALRIYILEAFGLFIYDIICRKLDTTTGFASITAIPNTNLVKLEIPIPATKQKRFTAAPGQHIYLSIPPESTPPNTSTLSIHNLLFNPFTIASVSATSITLVLRSLSGPTSKALKHLTTLPKAHPPISVEGPLGSTKSFPDLTSYDRILLIAGGIGATYILPLYEHLQDQMETHARSPDRVQLIWSIRSAADASWALKPEGRVPLNDDENVRIFITQHSSASEESVIPGSPTAIEMSDLKKEEVVVNARGGYERPDLKEVVDGVFKLGREERVAVVVCGTKGMARVVRGEVGRWVEWGREVWFHDEGFGW
ncbi:Ferredoxin reductase-like, C-terminal NADP-linked [Glarea lozoyensis ATCC 20868]|uniref:Ferredoxin reductase-like, C-terminal NADP-linked n=1 Tax=Glarea lozoyensis (strain ATCC 20868 / MF5171) TaxID=1116229 RepID=S3DFH9_GLAL2|nr:Ferredoxin reductase-like, C-terminal NADP-linked [Glarea lozoyensis ATCC 20868]EPE35864.1 Ferredoxin reductase-like, C-terminal NADP-linked [Glarea lozoyensis ATCC 20868]